MKRIVIRRGRLDIPPPKLLPTSRMLHRIEGYCLRCGRYHTVHLATLSVPVGSFRRKEHPEVSILADYVYNLSGWRLESTHIPAEEEARFYGICPNH